MDKTYITELKVPALPDFVGVVRLAVSGLLSRMNFSAEEEEDIKVAVSEACTNVVQYAYPKNKHANFINVKMIQKKNSIELIVADTGIGFNTKNPPRRSLHDDDIHMGLGLVFMRNLMDNVKITSKKNQGTKVQLFKKVKK